MWVRRIRRVILVDVVLAMVATMMIGADAPPGSSPLSDLTKLGFKFDGAQSCATAKCHDSPMPLANIHGNEFQLWSQKDPHALAFAGLSSPVFREDVKAADIGAKLNIAKVEADAKCMNCHTTAVPDNLRGNKFSLEEGVTCTACHGPSEKWIEPHAKDKWIVEQRKMAHDQLLAKLGLYDTLPPVARAERCVSCHLGIDAAMVAAGHPQPIFELAYFSRFEKFEAQGIKFANHWPDAKGYDDVKLWAAGQVVCAREALKQLAVRAGAGVDAAILKDTYQQAMSHLAVLRMILTDANGAALDAAMTKMKASAGDAKALAGDAAGAAQVVGKLTDVVEKFSPDESLTKGLLAAAAKADLAKDFGRHGMEQQAYTLSSLYETMARAKGAAPGPAGEALAALRKPLEKPLVDAAGYDQLLGKVRAALGNP